MSEEQIEDRPKTAYRVNNLEDSAVITVMVDSNPKREGSKAHEKFESYFKLRDDQGAFTVADYLAEGWSKIDLRYDVTHGFIEIEGAEVEEYEVTPRGEKSDEEASEDEGEELDDASGF